MPLEAVFTEDPAEALRVGRTHLYSDPILHNLILTLLAARIENPRPGRYWVVKDGSEPVGVGFQSPITFFASVTRMSREAASVLAEAMSRFDAPGVNGEAATSAAVAGRWTELRSCACKPTFAGRIYEFFPLHRPETDCLRPATLEDRDLMETWFEDFSNEIGEPQTFTPEIVERVVGAGQAFIWDDGRPRSLACVTAPVANVTRVQRVYTPPEQRNKGFATLCVSALSNLMKDRGLRCILYTDLANRTSNSVYRKVGYRAVAEVTRYEFF
ncbi:MAG TPA: GNAT family N-acetyltransferase [Fimbriimonas sp.]|nr:GNAT family N-acetyltransferase [Fimbriimonas sp.]